jgi:cytochrome c biogenesis protein CcdA
VTAIASGIFYAYLTLGLLSLSFLALADFVRQLAIVIGIILVLIAGLSFAEAAHDLYTRKWRQKKEAMLPIFRTPASIKNIIKEIALKNRLYFDFAIGALFSVIKLPCIAPLYLGISFYSDLRSFGFLTNLVAFDLGIVLPTLILGCLASTGLMSFSKLSTMRFAGRMIQRIVMGVALMGTAALILFQS